MNNTATTTRRTILSENGILTTYIKPFSLLDLYHQPERVVKKPTGEKNSMKVVWDKQLDYFCQPLVTPKPATGYYKIIFDTNHGHLLYSDIEKNTYTPQGWDVTTPTVLAQAVLNCFAATGKRLLDGWWSRTTGGGWTMKLPGGQTQSFHIRIGCNDNGNLVIDFHFPDDHSNRKTGVTYMQRSTLD